MASALPAVLDGQGLEFLGCPYVEEWLGRRMLVKLLKLPYDHAHQVVQGKWSFCSYLKNLVAFLGAAGEWPQMVSPDLKLLCFDIVWYHHHR